MTRDEDRRRQRRGDKKRGNHDFFSGYIPREGLGARGRVGRRAGQARATENIAMPSLLQVRKYGSARPEDSKLPGIASSFEELLEGVFCGFTK